MFTGLAKIYCDEGSPGAAAFMVEHAGRFDARGVGLHCADADPRLAVAAYDSGCCDDELLALTSERGLMQEQAAYLVKRRDASLWAKVLQEGADARRRQELVDVVVSSALPASRDADEVSAAVVAFIRAGLPEQLTAVLEKLVLDDDAGARVGDSRYQQNLQNLLLKTTIRGKRDRLMGYISRLTNYDHDEVAEYALKEGLHEEAYAVYRRKTGGELRAMQVLLNNVQSVDRAREYAGEVRSRECWRLLGVAQLQADLVADAIDSLVKAEDPAPAATVVAAARRTGQFAELVRYLRMAQKAANDAETRAVVDTELAYALARTDRLAELADFVAAPNLIHHNSVAERCFGEGLFPAASCCSRR